MLIEIHAIQNHSPANLNRDDLGAPKTCYFGGVLRSRISSQCLKRSIRMSAEFKQLLGGVRTRRLAKEIAGGDAESSDFNRAVAVLKLCGIAPKEKGKLEDEKSAGLVYTTRSAIAKMSNLLKAGEKGNEEMAREFAKLIAEHTYAPDMALFGRMLEPKKPEKNKKGKGGEAKEAAGEGAKGKGPWKGRSLTVEGALQVSHAISTHEARPEIDYYVAADDIPGEDGGASFVDEAMFASACFYKYFSINWETLVKNLNGNQELAAHTVGAFIRGVALVNPTGRQNSFAAHNPPDGVLVEIRNSPISYANAFAKPVAVGASIKEDGRDIISQSVAQLGQYIHDIDTGYGKPAERFWFSPNLRYLLTVVDEKTEIPITYNNVKSLGELVPTVVSAIGHDWEKVRKIVVKQEASDEREHAPASA